MLKAKCADCGGEFPINDTFELDGNVLCTTCAQKAWDLRPGGSTTPPRQQVDPTVCFNCSSDNQQTPLPTISSLPTCEKCSQFFQNYPFPDWIKVSLTAVLALVVFSFVYNGRFILAYSQIRRSRSALEGGDLEKAAALMASASHRVPEHEFLSNMAEFYRAAVMMKNNRSAEALQLLKKCKNNLPRDLGVDKMISSAEMTVAFDNKDYGKFLELALAERKKCPDDYVSVAQVASAYACKYASTRDEQFKNKALQVLAEADKLGLDQPQYQEYRQRILHRIHSHEIIDRDEFYRRYPEGWQIQEEAQQ